MQKVLLFLLLSGNIDIYPDMQNRSFTTQDLSAEKILAAAKPIWERMQTLLACGKIKYQPKQIFYGYKFRFDTGQKSLFVAINCKALASQIFGKETAEQYVNKLIVNNKTICEVEIPFEKAKDIIEKKWGHLVKQVEKK